MLSYTKSNQTKPLEIGDEVITVAASSALDDELALLDGLKVFESWGLVCRTQNIYGRNWGYLAGDDATRYKNLHPKKPANLLAFARGGWGAARLLEQPQPWKSGWLLGYSDITSILLARLSAGFDGGVHGPLINSLAYEPKWSQERLFSLLFGQPVPDISGETWVNGCSSGHLIVANLTVASHLIGTKHMPSLKGAIIIFEDVGEEPYRIDRMLTHWRLSGLLKDIAGLGFGSFSCCKPPQDTPKNKTFSVEDVLKERSRDLGIPVIGNLPIGHCCGNAALPLGRQALLDGRNGILSLIT